MILLDTSGLYALLYPGQREGDSVRAVLDAEEGPFILSPFVLCELDYLIASRARKPNLLLRFLDDISRGAYELAAFGIDGVAATAGVLRRYGDMRIGLTDASLVVLADYYRTNRILTLDERHFRVLRPRHTKSFVVLPADA